MSTFPRRVLVTGDRGYLGSVMAPHLAEEGYEVVGFDTGYFNDCTLVPEEGGVPSVRKDIRDVTPEDLTGVDAVVHLAALSNDPIGNLDERWTREINHEATVRLGEIAREAGVRRFLFSSSCIMYGAATADVCDEDTPLDPRTTYARSKASSEQALSELADDRFSPVFLRNGTVYGVSPRMRFDTVLNNLCVAGYATHTITVLSDGTPWRPVVHVQDVARAFARVLAAPDEDIHDQAFNTGAEHLNHQIRELAEIVAAEIPGCTVDVQGRPDADQRTYRADFSKFGRTFPDFEFGWDARSGTRELVGTFARIGLAPDAPGDPRFTRLARLNLLLSAGSLDGDLRWTDTEGAR
ncbi:MAG: NAD-dependent epimerase/dehydratase family protein [Acidimicrobiales bacterium]